MNNTKRMAGKVLQWNYDTLLATSDQKCCFQLTRRDVAMIMAITEQMHWQTRYLSTSGSNIDMNLVDAWASGLENRLMDGCCPDGTLSRFTADGVFQTSVDDGTTWQDNTGSDPRNQGTTAPPLPGSGASTKCAAADNIRDNFKSMRDNTISLLTAGTTLLAILAGLIGLVGVILGLTGAATGIGVLLIGLSAGLLSLTPAEVAAEIDDGALDDFKCLVYCHLEDNGQMTYEGWKALITDIGGHFSGFKLTFFMSITQSLGYIGMSNAGTMGEATADDCDSCGCSDCIYDWPVANIPGFPACGTFLGEFDGYLRYSSTPDIIGQPSVNIMTDAIDKCCTVLDFRLVSGTNPTVYAKIICGGTHDNTGNITSGITIGDCVSYLAFAHGTDAFTIEVLFAGC